MLRCGWLTHACRFQLKFSVAQSAWLKVHTAPDPVAPVFIPRRVCEKNVELARWCCTAGCEGCITALTGSSRDHSTALTGSSRDHSEACRKRIETAVRADEELFCRVVKAVTRRNVPQDETKKISMKTSAQVQVKGLAPLYRGRLVLHLLQAQVLGLALLSASGRVQSAMLENVETDGENVVAFSPCR